MRPGLTASIAACAALAVRAAEATPPDVELGTATGLAVATGNIPAGESRRSALCGGECGPEVVIRWTAPRTDAFFLDTFGSARGTILYVAATTPDVIVSACDDGERNVQARESVRLEAGNVVDIVLDSSLPSGGAYSLSIVGAGDLKGGVPCIGGCPPTSLGPPCCRPGGGCGYMTQELVCSPLLDGGAAIDAGVPTPPCPSGPDAAAECDPRQRELCTCADGGEGVRICRDDATGFGRCNCVRAEDSGSDDGGCGCRISQGTRDHDATLALLTLIAAGLVRRGFKAGK